MSLWRLIIPVGTSINMLTDKQNSNTAYTNYTLNTGFLGSTIKYMHYAYNIHLISHHIVFALHTTYRKFRLFFLQSSACRSFADDEALTWWAHSSVWRSRSGWSRWCRCSRCPCHPASPGYCCNRRARLVRRCHHLYNAPKSLPIHLYGLMHCNKYRFVLGIGSVAEKRSPDWKKACRGIPNICNTSKLILNPTSRWGA